MGEVKTEVAGKPAESEVVAGDLAIAPEREMEVNPGDIFDEVIQAASKLDAYAKAQDMILKIIIKRTFAGDWVCHAKDTTPEAERTANLGAAGAERIANFLGVEETNWKALGKEWSEDKKHYSYGYSADFSFRGIVRHAEGRAGTRDKFFSGGKALEDVNEDDIRVAAFRECFKKGITRLFGLRAIPLTKLKELGYDIGLVKMVDYADKGKQVKRDELKPREGGLVSKTIQVVKLEKFEGVNKDTKKAWVRFDVYDKEGIKYTLFADGTSKRVLKLAECEDDQQPIGILFKVVMFNGRENYQIEKVEGVEG